MDAIAQFFDGQTLVDAMDPVLFGRRQLDRNEAVGDEAFLAEIVTIGETRNHRWHRDGVFALAELGNSRHQGRIGGRSGGRKIKQDIYLDSVIIDDLAQVGKDFLWIVAGKQAAIEFGHGGRRNDVSLIASGENSWG